MRSEISLMTIFCVTFIWIAIGFTKSAYGYGGVSTAENDDMDDFISETLDDDFSHRPYSLYHRYTAYYLRYFPVFEARYRYAYAWGSGDVDVSIVANDDFINDKLNLLHDSISGSYWHSRSRNSLGYLSGFLDCDATDDVDNFMIFPPRIDYNGVFAEDEVIYYEEHGSNDASIVKKGGLLLKIPNYAERPEENVPKLCGWDHWDVLGKMRCTLTDILQGAYRQSYDVRNRILQLIDSGLMFLYSQWHPFGLVYLYEEAIKSSEVEAPGDHDHVSQLEFTPPKSFATLKHSTSLDNFAFNLCNHFNTCTGMLILQVLRVLQLLGIHDNLQLFFCLVCFMKMLPLFYWLQVQLLKIWQSIDHTRCVINTCARFTHHDKCWGFTSAGEWLRMHKNDLTPECSCVCSVLF